MTEKLSGKEKFNRIEDPFKDDFHKITNSKLTKKQKKEKLRQLAQKSDEEMDKQNLQPFWFGKNSYKERVERYIEKMFVHTRIIKQDRSLITSERMVNYIFSQLKIKGIEGYGTRGRELDFKLMWVVDFLSGKITDHLQKTFKDQNDGLVLFKNADIFLKWIDRVRNGQIAAENSFIQFEFNASEVKDELGLSSDKKISIKDVVGLFEKLQEVIFEVRGLPVIFDAEEGGWRKFKRKKGSDTLYYLESEKTGVIVSNRWKTKDYKLSLTFNSPIGWLFLANLSCGKPAWLTLPRSAHNLPEYEQNILREIRLWKKPRPYYILELAAIAGLKGKDVSKLKKSLIRVLTNLKNKKYIKDFKFDAGRGKKTKFTIIKNEVF